MILAQNVNSESFTNALESAARAVEVRFGMPTPTQALLYLAAAVMFIFALQGMASPKTARRGNLLGAIGMLLAIVGAIFFGHESVPIQWGPVLVGVVLGSGIGAFLALWVQMTAMPQMVAMFNGFGGLASALVVLAFTIKAPPAAGQNWEGSIAGISTLIGWLTLTGSLVAFAKLQEVVISSKPITFPFQNIANFGLLGGTVLLIVIWGFFPSWWPLIIPIALAACALGILFTIPIGGADMPVVISLLNSYSGLAAAATGFVLQNSGLIIAGSLVGASGIILTRLMCHAMNRSLANVLFAAVGQTSSGERGDESRVTSWSAEDAAMSMANASLVIVVPGYGMAVAQAQHVIKEMADILENQGVNVKFGIHPVAGRMPGHMNVLLAEAEVPYEKLCDMDEINPEFEQADAVLVIGANDVINPEARKEGNPISGMPILDVDKAGTVMICKRSLSPGFAGIDNPLFYADNTAMLFGDGKKMITDLVAALKNG